MKPLYLLLKNFIGIRSGLGQDELELDLSDRVGLVALVGPNGKGKTTVLDNLHPYRLMPFRAKGYSERKFSYYDETVGDAYKELIWSHAGEVYRSVIAIKGAGKVQRTVATLYREVADEKWEPVRLDDGTVSDGKTESYDACVHHIVGSPEMFFTAAFSAQERKRLCDYPAGDIKLLLSELLGLDELLELSAAASEAAKHVNAQAEGLAAQMQAFEADTAALAGKRTLIAQAAAALTEKTDTRAGLRSNATAAAQALAVAQAEHGQEAAREAERQRLALERLDIESEGKRQLEALEIAIKAKVAEGLAADLCATRDQAETRINGHLERKARLTSAAAFKITPAEAETTVRAANDAVTVAEARVEYARGAHMEAKDAAAKVAELTGRLSSIKREGGTTKETLAAAKRRGELLTRVPCAGMDIASTCELLSDAREGQSKVADLAATVDQLRTDYSNAETELASVQPVAAELTTRAQAFTLAETELKRERERLTTAQGDVSRAANAQAARVDLEDVEALITTDTAIYRDAQREIALRADAADQAAQGLRDQIPQTKAATQERQQRVDAALAAIPKAGDGKALEAAKKASQDAETALSNIEVEITAGQNQRARLEAEAQVLEARLAEAEDVRKRAIRMADDVGQWRLLSKALGKDGVVALAIDDAGPSISSLTNDLLLACYGPRFTVRFDTQTEKADGSLREDFEIRVFDGERDDEKSLTKTSGGERIWLNEAITRAIGLHRARASGSAYDCLFSDESDGALDPAHKAMFMNMKRKVMELGGVDTEFYITHTPELWALADSVIDFTQLGA